MTPIMSCTSIAGPGTVVVIGDVLYFYTWQYDNNGSSYSLPRLNTITFREYYAGAESADLVGQGLAAYNVLNYNKECKWDALYSPIYPSGRKTVTISVENYYGLNAEKANTWAIDAVVTVTDTASRGPRVVYFKERFFIKGATRAVITVPGYTCAAYEGAVTCYIIDDGSYAWNENG